MISFGSKRLAAALCAALLLCGAVSAQSGRRPKGRTTPPEMAPLPTETAPKQEPQARETTVGKVAATHWLASMGVSNRTSSYMMAEIAKRLRADGRFAVTATERETNRKAAIEMAKASTEEHVLWVEFGTDEDTYRRSGRRRAIEDQLVADYWLYEPGSGESLLHGRVFFTAGGSVVGTGGRGVPRFPGDVIRPGGLTAPAAAEHIAKHVMQALVSQPTVPLPAPAANPHELRAQSSTIVAAPAESPPDRRLDAGQRVPLL